jgi:hypothetical protein
MCQGRERGSLSASAQAQRSHQHTRDREAARSTRSADSRRIRSSLRTRLRGDRRSSRIGRRASRGTRALPRRYVLRGAWDGWPVAQGRLSWGCARITRAASNRSHAFPARFAALSAVNASAHVRQWGTGRASYSQSSSGRSMGGSG